jgi:hypothetical protein
MVRKFRKKPVVIESIQWNGKNFSEVYRFCPQAQPYLATRNDELWITTLEGGHIASVGDWIIKEVNNEFYPCKPDIFEKTYEPVD